MMQAMLLPACRRFLPLYSLVLASALGTLALHGASAAAQPAAAPGLPPGPSRGLLPGQLPEPVRAALVRAGIGPEALAAVVVAADAPGAGRELPRLDAQSARSVPVASLMKLFTTFAALERLGPAWQWRTPVRLAGTLSASGTLRGDLVIQGVGDPTLVQERLWLLLQRLRARGVQSVRGDIVLDDSAFEAAAEPASAFDGEPLKPYNALPHALTLNHASVTLRLLPVADRATVRVAMEPPLPGVTWLAKIKLTRQEAVCGDWRSQLHMEWSRPARPRLIGNYALACGEKDWPVAWPDVDDFRRRLVAGMWKAAGGRLSGQVVIRRPVAEPAPEPAASAAEAASPDTAFLFESPPLADVVRQINKYSNNRMARELFLTLGQQLGGAGNLQAARQAVAAHALERAACTADELVLDNGSGLSRSERASPACLARLLQAAWASPVMPELFASLPINAVDGTARRSLAVAGRAHVKTGSLDGVAGVAGIVQGDSGRRWVVVGVIHHAQAGSARAALDALIDWAAADRAP